MRKMAFALIILVLALGGIVANQAQESLGDLARRLREERSKATKKPTKVYTNDNLPPRPANEGPTVAAGMSSATAEGSGPPASASTSNDSNPPKADELPKAESAGDKSKSQEYWLERFKAVREPLAKAEEEQQLAEDELNLLQIQEARELDPTAKADLEEKIKAKQAEIESKRAATEKTRKALEDLEKQFKDSGAPEDWSKPEQP
jgi:hypothetical protein